MFGKKMILSGAICFSALCVGAYAEDEVESCDACEEVVAVQEPVEATDEVTDEVTLEREELTAEATEESVN